MNYLHSSNSLFSLFFSSNYCCQFLLSAFVLTFYYYYFYYSYFLREASRNSYLLFKCYCFIFPFFSVLRHSSIGIHWFKISYFVFLIILFHSQQTAISTENDEVTFTFWCRNDTQWESKLRI